MKLFAVLVVGLVAALWLASAALGSPAPDETFASIVTCVEAEINIEADLESGWYNLDDSGNVSRTNNRRINSCWHPE